MKRQTRFPGADRLKAFTLIEVLLATFVFGIAITGILSVLLGSVRAIGATSEAADENARLRVIQERFLYDLRSVASVTDWEQLGSVNDGGTNVAVYRQFSANIYPRSASVDLAPIPVTYKFANNAIIRIDPGHPTGVPVLSGISDAWFQFYNRKGTSSGDVTSIQSQVTAIRVTYVPLGSRYAGSYWTNGSCSALIQLRNPTFQ